MNRNIHYFEYLYTLNRTGMEKFIDISTLRQIIMAACAAAATCACSSGKGGDDPVIPPGPEERLPIRISSAPETRATDNAFETGDRIGVFVVNRNADGSAVPLKTSGNYIDNTMYSLYGTWTAAETEYWKDNTTHADFYMYYPYTGTINNVEAMPWSVRADQSTEGGYKASELLIGKTLDVAPGEDAVTISARHVMAQVAVTLTAGNGFLPSDISNGDISVRINNMKTLAAANIATGDVSAIGGATDITPWRENGIYKALVVPQTLGDGYIIKVTADGTDFLLKKDTALKAFEAGHTYQFTVTLSKTTSGMNATIVKWQDDGNDYGGTAEPE